MASILGLFFLALAVGVLVQKTLTSLATDIVAVLLGALAVAALAYLPENVLSFPLLYMVPTMISAFILIGGVLCGYQHPEQRRAIG
ncbi:MAG: hypothetical protein K2Z81_10665 [Cyanobacteria bacterium]|nr:hypothetical protein [Cyanobacteriota bacterium]